MDSCRFSKPVAHIPSPGVQETGRIQQVPPAVALTEQQQEAVGKGLVHLCNDGKYYHGGHGLINIPDHKFFVYPQNQSIKPYAYWDTHLAPREYCTNHARSGKGRLLKGYCCLGHDVVQDCDVRILETPRTLQKSQHDKN